MKKLPVYKVVVTEDTYMVANSLVDIPAHLKKAYVFNNQKHKQYFADKKRGVVMGVAIAADQLIYRNDANGEYNVYFDADAIWNIREKLMKSGDIHLVNFQHSDKIVPSYLLDSYIIDRKRGFHVPEPFEDQNLADGSWIVSYKVESKEILDMIDQGKLGGFSIEAYLDLVEMKFKSHSDRRLKFFSSNNMRKNTKKKLKQVKKTNSMSLKEKVKMIFGKKKFASATTDAGVVIMWDGDLEVGVSVTLEDGSPAPEGEHTVVIDGLPKIIEIDSEGKVTAIKEAQPADVDEEFQEILEGIAESVQEQMEAAIKPLKEQFEALKKENDALKAKFEKAFPDQKKEGKEKKFAENPFVSRMKGGN